MVERVIFALIPTFSFALAATQEAAQGPCCTPSRRTEITVELGAGPEVFWSKLKHGTLDEQAGFYSAWKAGLTLLLVPKFLLNSLR